MSDGNLQVEACEHCRTTAAFPHHRSLRLANPPRFTLHTHLQSLLGEPPGLVRVLNQHHELAGLQLPLARILKRGDRLAVEALPPLPRGRARHDRVRLHIVRHDAARAYHCAVAYAIATRSND